MSAPCEGAPATPDASALPDPPIVLRAVRVDDDVSGFLLDFQRTPDGSHVAIDLAGRAIVDVNAPVRVRGASLSLRTATDLYGLHAALGVLITEAEAAGLLTPAWAATTEEG